MNKDISGISSGSQEPDDRDETIGTPTGEEKTISMYLTEKGIGALAVDLDAGGIQMIGRERERYCIAGELARGGMGAVLNAKDLNLRRQVAMKIVLDPQAAQNSQIIRFVHEAQVTGQLEHPSIVPVYELGVDTDDNVYYTMKYIRGTDLGSIISGIRAGNREMLERYSLPRLLNIFIKACEAMAFAHSRGVIHRDLKPDNLMVGDYGEVLVVDWGLAKVMGDMDAAPSAQDDVLREAAGAAGSRVESVRDGGAQADRTIQGAVMGTPAYMPPEQASGNIEALGPSADVYSMGAILYSMLTLEAPFEDDDVHVILEKVRRGGVREPHQHGGPHPHCPEGRIPASLSAVVMKAMSHRPSDRYGSVQSLQADVQAYLDGFATSAEEAGLWRLTKLFIARHRAKVIAGAAAALILAVVIVVAFMVNLRERRIAEHARNVAQRAEEKAVTAKNQADRENYASQIRLADALLSQGDRGGMLNVLDQTDPGMRSWEWGYLMTQVLHPEWSLKAHQNDLTGFALSKDGSKFATVGDGGKVRVWNATDHKLIWEHSLPTTLEGKNLDFVVEHHPKFFNDDKLLAVVCWDRVIVLRVEPELPAGERMLGGIGDLRLYHAAYDVSPDEPTVFLGRDKTVRRFEWMDGRWQKTAESSLFEDQILRVRLDEAGRYVFAVGNEATKRMRFLRNPSLELEQSVALQDGSGARMAEIHINSQADQVYFQLSNSIYSAMFSEFMQGSRGVAMHRFEDGMPLFQVSSDGDQVLCGSKGPHGALMDLRAGAAAAYAGAPVIGLGESGETLVAADAAGRVSGWNRSALQRVSDGGPSGEERWSSRFVISVFSSLLIHPSSEMIVLSPFRDNSGDRFCFFELGPGDAHLLLMGNNSGKGGNHHPRALAFHPDGKSLVIRAQGLPGLTVLHTSNPSKIVVERLADLPIATGHFDGRGAHYICSGAAPSPPESNVQVIDWTTKQRLDTTPLLKGGYVTAITKDGAIAAAAGGDGPRLTVWETKSGKVLLSQSLSPSKPSAIAFHPGGGLIAIGNARGEIRITDLSAPSKPRKLPGQSGGIQHLQFSPDGERLMCAALGTVYEVSQGGGSGGFRLFDWRSGRELLSRNTAYGPLHAELTPDGRSLAIIDGGYPSLRIYRSLPWSLDRHSDGFLRAAADLRARHDSLCKERLSAEENSNGPNRFEFRWMGLE